MALSSASRRSTLLVARGLDPVGTGRQLELVAGGLLAAGWRVRVAVTSAGGAMFDRLAAGGARVDRLGLRPAPDAAAVARLVGVLRTESPEVVVAWGRSQSRLAAAALLLGRSRSRLVCWLGIAPRGMTTLAALRRADRVVAASPHVADECVRLGLPAERVIVVPPGAAPAEPTGLSRRDLAERLGLDAGRIWTLCAAPLEPQARLERLLWAIDQLGVVHRRLEHVLVGGGPLRQRLLRRARVQQLAERLHLFPDLDCLPDLLREVRLVWQSGEVACGGAILDGMAAGIPAVAVTSDAARQLIVDGLTGRIVPAEPESELPRRALGILEDDGLAAAYAAAARQRAETEFPVDRMIAGILAAIET
ncbi:MAG: putative glycosyltransferase EpsD [Planctomycetota bacterium]|jgi:glycosyltransferase involved in cell wall biosynthesis